jgi:multimeric flavodoxin WrbA
MVITCISASNVKHAKSDSTSLKACKLIKDITEERYPQQAYVDIISLVEYSLSPCTGCGRCYEKRKCISDEAFNSIYSRLRMSDGLFIVSAHYAPIPSKLCVLLEKIGQLAFLPRFHNETSRSPLYGKPVGIIAHGRGTGDIIVHYKGLVLDVIANALSWPVEMDIAGINDEWNNGIAFPVKNVIMERNAVFPIHEYDWEDIKRRIGPLVDKVLGKVRHK